MFLELNDNGRTIIALGQFFYYEDKFHHATMLGYCSFNKNVVAQLRTYFLTPVHISQETAMHPNAIIRQLCMHNLAHLDILCNDPSQVIAVGSRERLHLMVA